MLPSEFTERTKVTLTGEQYAKVEAVYDNVEMDKDEFCKEWLKLRNNKLMKEVQDAMYKMASQIYAKEQEVRNLKNQLEEQKKFYEGSIEKGGQKWADTMAEFAKRIIRANEDGELRVYDVVEEEYGIGFIIKAKHEAGITLTEEEIKYMVGKL